DSLSRVRNDRRKGARLRLHFTAESLAETAMRTRASSAIRLRNDRHRRRLGMPAELASAGCKEGAGRFYWQRRQRIRFRAWRVERTLHSRYSEIPFSFCVVWL